MDAAALQRARHKPCAGEPPIIVAKLGGSVVRSGQLVPWLEALAKAQARIVVVPGGGALADEVRTCQHELGFGDAAAHRMALLAMDQLAWAVAGMRPGLEVGAAEADLHAILKRGHTAVWAPYALIEGRGGIEESWRLTSDSLALWLAARLGAKACYLIKSIETARVARSVGTLARDGVVDAAFPAMLAETGVEAAILGPDDQQAFVQSLAGTAPHAGVRIE